MPENAEYVPLRQRLQADLHFPNQVMAAGDHADFLEWGQMLHAIGFQWNQHYHLAQMRDVLDAGSEGLWDAWLANLPLAWRETHDCPHCRAFVDQHGGYFVRSYLGRIIPLFWSPMRVPQLYYDSTRAIEQLIISRAAQAPRAELPPRPWGTSGLYTPHHGGGNSHMSIPATPYYERRK